MDLSRGKIHLNSRRCQCNGEKRRWTGSSCEDRRYLSITGPTGAALSVTFFILRSLFFFPFIRGPWSFLPLFFSHPLSTLRERIVPFFLELRLGARLYGTFCGWWYTSNDRIQGSSICRKRAFAVGLVCLACLRAGTIRGCGACSEILMGLLLGPRALARDCRRSHSFVILRDIDTDGGVS